jgi:hypothetical protein
VPEDAFEFETQFGVPRCRRCAYVLENLPGSRCPECGTPFDFDDPDTYTLKPPLVRWRFWLPGLTLAVVGGMASYLVVLGLAGFGAASTLVLPACVGAIIGYSCRVRMFLIILLGLIALAGMCMGLFTLSLVSLYCGLILAGIALGPLIIGTVCGMLLRLALKRSRFDQRWHLPLIAFLLLPTISGLVERRVRGGYAAETVRTSLVMDAPPRRAWDAVMFYEEVRHAPPALFRLGMPRPLYTSGSSAAVGDEKTCVYDKGTLTKRITGRDPQRRLAFRVVEQGFEQHAMTLAGGAFEFEPDSEDAGRTRVTLSTTYHPHLGPRWCWRPFERLTVHTLHGHVLAGMAERAREATPSPGEAAEVRR